METQKIVNLLNSPENIQNLQQKRWYLIDSESKNGYSHHDPIKFSAKSIESGLCDYSDAYIFLTGDISVTRSIAVAAGFPARTQPQRKQVFTAATQLAFKNCAPFKDCRTEIDGTLLIMQILSILQCLLTIGSNTLTIILIVQEVHGI